MFKNKAFLGGLIKKKSCLNLFFLSDQSDYYFFFKVKSGTIVTGFEVYF